LAAINAVKQNIWPLFYFALEYAYDKNLRNLGCQRVRWLFLLFRRTGRQENA
jgi:hypothetical protein